MFTFLGLMIIMNCAFIIFTNGNIIIIINAISISIVLSTRLNSKHKGDFSCGIFFNEKEKSFGKKKKKKKENSCCETFLCWKCHNIKDSFSWRVAPTKGLTSFFFTFFPQNCIFIFSKHQSKKYLCLDSNAIR